MSFHSILFDQPGGSAVVDGLGEPSYFSDLNLDQILATMTAGREEYTLKPFFYAPLHDVAAVLYRQEILCDLERSGVFHAVKSFAEELRQMRKHRAQAEKLYYRYQKERWFLDAIDIYCAAVVSLYRNLDTDDVTSRGLHLLREYLEEYTRSEAFTSLVTETKAIQEDISRIRYCITIKGNRVRVSMYDGEDDYSSDVEATFEKFKQGSVESYSVKFNDWPDMSYVEARILEIVARLNAATFQALDDYCTRHRSFLDPMIGAFDREIQFYIAYLEFIDTIKYGGLNFCYPQVSTQSKEIHVEETFDLALASKLVQEHATVTCNDFSLTDPERIVVVTGPNQGGKTTFARTFGQLHYLASLGYPVPGRAAQLFLPDRLFTHFEREETIQTLMGKLEDELTRIHDILEQATGNSMVIMNESFTSTTLRDALFLGREVLERMMRLDLLCVYVTFVDELTSLSKTIVSMSSTVLPDNPAIRTYKVVRKQADGLAYAAALAEKYGLTYQSLRRRVAR